jgi:hypothetical protein
MNNLQDAINQFQSSKLGKIKETVLSHMVGAQRASEVRLKLYEDRRKQKQNDPKVLEEKKRKMEKHKEYEKEKGRILGKTKGKLNMTDYTREMSKVPTTCPNCNTVGPLSNMKQHHFDKCKRTVGYSDEKVIESYLNGMSIVNISKESVISWSQVKVIVRKYKKSLVGK